MKTNSLRKHHDTFFYSLKEATLARTPGKPIRIRLFNSLRTGLTNPVYRVFDETNRKLTRELCKQPT